MKEITKTELLTHFDLSVQDAIDALFKRDGVSHLVEFVNVAFDSSAFGANSVLSIGPGCTWKTLAEVESKVKWLKDLPSQRQYPQYYVRKEES